MPMCNDTQLPKDFVVVQGYGGTPQAHWLQHVAYHTVVWAVLGAEHTSASAPAHMQPVTMEQWSAAAKEQLADVTMTRPWLTHSQWMQLYRKGVVAMNKGVRGEERGAKEVHDMVKAAGLILKGQERRGEAKQRKLPQKYLGAIAQWEAVSAVWLRGDTMRVLQLTHSVVVRILFGSQTSQYYPFNAFRFIGDLGQLLAHLYELDVCCVFPHLLRPVPLLHGVLALVHFVPHPNVAQPHVRQACLCVSVFLRTLFGGKLPDLRPFHHTGTGHHEPPPNPMAGGQQRSLRMAFHKATRDDINKHTRPINILTALHRVKAKLLNHYLQGCFTPHMYG